MTSMTTPDAHTRFPNDSCFSQLLTIAEQKISSVIVNDPTSGIKADYNRLLHDISAIRRTLCKVLPSHLLQNGSILQGDPIYVCTLLGPNYNFIIALLSILAIGGAVVPLSTTLLLDEALCLITRCNATYLIVDPENAEFAVRIQARFYEQTGLNIYIVRIDLSQAPVPTTRHCCTIDRDITFSPGRVGLILFSSGTTGPPKGIIHSRSVFYNAKDLVRVRKDGQDIFLIYRTVVSAGGVLPLTRYVLTGVQLEIFNQAWDAAALWERLRKGGLTILVGAPSLWLKLQKHYESTLVYLPEEERRLYVKGAQDLRVAVYIGAVAMPTLKQFWWDLRQGRALVTSYGSTELGSSVISSSIYERPETFHRPILGTTKNGFEVKLSEGSRGEILVRSPFVFAGYLNDEGTSSSVLDDEGFFKTGDLAHIEGESFVFDGRAESDFIKFLFGFRVPRLLVEAQVAQLPGITEALVVGVPDPECEERVGAIIRTDSTHISLEGLRQDLSTHLPLYQLPTILYVLKKEEDVPLTRTNKPDLRKALSQFFPLESPCSLGDCSQNGVQVYDISKLRGMKPERPWDWAGIQR